jgi:HPt (histidine-containing phosphotransfer) domain-containing protein
MSIPTESSAEKLDAPVFDPIQFGVLTELHQDGDAEFFVETIRLFLEDTEKLMAGLEALVHERAFAKITTSAHTIKGGCSTFGMALAGVISMHLEAAAKLEDICGIDLWHSRLKEAFIAGREAMLHSGLI